MSQHRTRRAFTLVEILTVTAIVAVIAAIGVTVYGSAKKSAYKADAIAKLHQCSAAMLIYLSDHDETRSLPGRDATLAFLGYDVTCDKADYWRTGCHQDWGTPMVGSFGYAGAYRTVALNAARQNNPPLFFDLFYNDPRIVPFHGDHTTPQDRQRYDFSYLLPTRVLVGRMDGSVTFVNPASVAPPTMGITWLGVFLWSMKKDNVLAR